MPFDSRTVSVGIARPAAEVYAFVADPRNLAAWASGLGGSIRAAADGEWLADGPMGRVAIRFVEHNRYGVLDHLVRTAGGEETLNPMRVVANGDGSEVMFTLFRRAGLSQADFARDADWVARDLAALKRLLEA